MRTLSLMILFAIVLSFGAVLAEDTLELTEVGIELATKAAEIYAEELYPGSSFGPAEPIYNLTLDGSITGWYFFVDTTGETEPTKDDIYAAIDQWAPQLDTFLTNDEFERIQTIAQMFIDKYKFIHINNHQEGEPLIETGRIAYPFTFSHRRKLRAEGKEIQDISLFSNMFMRHLYIAYKCSDITVYYGQGGKGRVPDGKIAERVYTPTVSPAYVENSLRKWTFIIEDRIEDLREIDEKLQPHYIHS